MERKEGENPFSPRARKLISKAFKEGVDPVFIREEMQIAIGIAQERGRERVTRGDLAGLVERVEFLQDLKGRTLTSSSKGGVPEMEDPQF